jgi:hypothetical protein
MKSEKLIIEEVSRMKSLFGYERGRVISEQKSNTPVIDFNKLPQKIDNIWNSTNELVAAGFPNTGNILADPNFPKYYDRGYSDTTGNYFWTKKKTAPTIVSQQSTKTTAGSATKTPVTPVGSATKPPVPRKPDPKVIEIQKQIKAALPNFDLGKSGPNKDGIDGIMGAKTRAGQKLMIQQKGQQALQGIAQQGRDLTNKFNQTIQNNSQLNSQQQANANAIKSGQPLPGTRVSDAPVVTDQPPIEPGQFGEIRDGWQWNDKRQEWNKLP